MKIIHNFYLLKIERILPFQRDRITSFRKQGMKKEKPIIQHPTDPISTHSELPIPQPLFDERSLNLSEKEIVDLFEKMMVSYSFEIIHFFIFY